MNDFADASPFSWLDDSHVLVMQAPEKSRPSGVGSLAEMRRYFASATFGLAVLGVMSVGVSFATDKATASQIANERPGDGLPRSYWKGLALALSQAPEVQDYEDFEEVAPVL